MYNFIDLFCGAGGFAKGFEMTSSVGSVTIKIAGATTITL